MVLVHCPNATVNLADTEMEESRTAAYRHLYIQITMWITVLLAISKLSQGLQLVFIITSHLKSKGKGEAMEEKCPSFLLHLHDCSTHQAMALSQQAALELSHLPSLKATSQHKVKGCN